jgi:hypothetical protein
MGGSIDSFSFICSGAGRMDGSASMQHAFIHGGRMECWSDMDGWMV